MRPISKKPPARSVRRRPAAPGTYTKTQIVGEIYAALERLDADVAIVGSGAIRSTMNRYLNCCRITTRSAKRCTGRSEVAADNISERGETPQCLMIGLRCW